MRKLLIAVAIIGSILTGSALADYVYRDANGTIQTFFAFTCAVTKNCSAQVLIDSTGTEKATAANPLISAVIGSQNVTPIDCSGTITTGGTAQNAIAASTTIHGFTIANVDAVAGSGEPLWISFTGTASVISQSFPLAAPAATTFSGMGSYTTPVGFGPNHAVSVLAATTGHKWSCTQW